MSENKYRSIFSVKSTEAIVFIILQMFSPQRGKATQIFPNLSWGTFSHVTRLDQSRAGENI